jgi:hypothetical protein
MPTIPFLLITWMTNGSLEKVLTFFFSLLSVSSQRSLWMMTLFIPSEMTFINECNGNSLFDGSNFGFGKRSTPLLLISISSTDKASCLCTIQ